VTAALLGGCGPSGKARTDRSPGPAFRDVARAHRILFQPDPGRKSPQDILQTAGFGGGWVDYDSDGWLDLLLVGRPRCALYHNELGRAFRRVTEPVGLEQDGYWQGCATGDFDNDGWMDLFLSGYRCAALLRNRGGRFEPVPLTIPRGSWGTSAAFLDADGDGLVDLYVGRYLQFDDGSPRLCNSLGVLGACSPERYRAQAGLFYWNRGGSRFQEATRRFGLERSHGKTLGVAVCDANEDGRTDLYLANDQVPGDLYLNTGSGFVNRGMESGAALASTGFVQGGMGVDWADVDGNGRPDLVVTTSQHEATSLYLNRGRELFHEAGETAGLAEPTRERLGFGAKFFDADNDGYEDLLLANGHVRDVIEQQQPGVPYAQAGQLFRRVGNRFAEVWTPECRDVRRPMVGRAVAVADYDNDGRLDALMTDREGPPRLLRNVGGAGNHWLRLRLRGTASPRDGAGAEVLLTTGRRTQIRWAGSSGSYLAAHDGRVHFGLGTAARAARVEVRWPSGRRQVFTDLAADREWDLVEP